MAYLMLYGNGWTQRWRIAKGQSDHIRSQISAVGTPTTGRLTVLDPSSDEEVSLVVAWALVASAVVIEGAAGSQTDDTAGQYR